MYAYPLQLPKRSVADSIFENATGNPSLEKLEKEKELEIVSLYYWFVSEGSPSSGNQALVSALRAMLE